MNETTETLEPLMVTASESEKAQAYEIDVPQGHVLIIAIDAEGQDMPGTEFFYPEKSYQRFYGDETKYRVKKKVH